MDIDTLQNKLKNFSSQDAEIYKKKLESLVSTYDGKNPNILYSIIDAAYSFGSADGRLDLSKKILHDIASNK
jgi:hypothetical protein